eukprot:3848566-Pyramimonas_sp.AAC.1
MYAQSASASASGGSRPYTATPPTALPRSFHHTAKLHFHTSFIYPSFTSKMASSICLSSKAFLRTPVASSSQSAMRGSQSGLKVRPYLLVALVFVAIHPSGDVLR